MTTHDIDREKAPVYRRRRFSAPHRRRRLWVRLLKPFAAALLVVGVPASTAYWVLTSSTFRLAETSVSGSGRVPLRWVESKLENLVGTHILALGVEDVESALSGHPWVRGVEIRKRLPAHLEVRILERRAVALLKVRSGLFFLDRFGEIIAPFDPHEEGGDFVLIDAETEEPEILREGLAIAEAWAKCAGPWATTLSEVEAVDGSSFRLYSSALDFPLLVTRDRLDTGLRALREHLPKINRQYPDLVLADLRFSEQLVFQRAVDPPMEG